jgi:hypothetical protein
MEETKQKQSPFKLQKNVPTHQYGRTFLIYTPIGVVLMLIGGAIGLLGTILFFVGLASGIAWLFRKLQGK